MSLKSEANTNKDARFGTLRNPNNPPKKDPSVGTEKNVNPNSKNAESDASEEGLEELELQPQSYLQKNLNDIILITILASLTVINFFTEAKLASLNYLYIVILITGYSLGRKFAVLSAFLTILLVWVFVLTDKEPYLIHHTNEMLNFYLTLWGGFLILSGWLGSAVANAIHGKPDEES